MQIPTVQVHMSDGSAVDSAVVVGEHQSDVEQALRTLIERVHEKSFSPAAMFIAIDFMAAAVAVLEAGAKSIGEPVVGSWPASEDE